MPTAHARLLLAALVTVYGTVLLALALAWNAAGVLSQHNLFFNADPDSNLSSLAHGSWGRLAPSHPGLELLSLPVRAVAHLLARMGAADDVIRLRELLALGYSPGATLLTLAVSYRTLTRLGLASADACAATAIVAASFSTLLFGALPETYALSGLCVALLLLQFVDDTGPRHAPRHLRWIAAGLAATLVTITHAVTAGLLYGALLWHQRRSATAASVRALAMTAGLVAAGLCVHVLLVTLFGVASGSEGHPRWIARFLSLDPARVGLNALSFPLASVQAIAAFGATVGPRPFCVSGPCLGLTFSIEAVTPAAVGALAMAGIGAPLAWRRLIADPLRQRLAVPVALVLGFNLALHAVFGDEVFLYAKHWMGATSLVFLPLLSGHARRAWGLAAVLLLHNLRVLLGSQSLVGY